MTIEVTTTSEQETERLGKHIATKLRGGEILQLKGDLGAGKTAFTRGLVEGLDSEDQVSSPTFAICNTYHGKFTVHHCDFYRLADDQLIANEISDLYDEESVLVLEWAENLPTSLKIDLINIELETQSDTERKITLRIPSKYGYMYQ